MQVNDWKWGEGGPDASQLVTWKRSWKFSVPVLLHWQRGAISCALALYSTQVVYTVPGPATQDPQILEEVSCNMTSFAYLRVSYNMTSFDLV